jgi:hypothetical protein
MHANLYQDYFGRDTQSIIPENKKGVFVVNNYMDKKAPDDYYPVLITDDKLGVRAFPCIWNEKESKYEQDKRWLMFGGRLIYTSNSAGYYFRYPAKLMDRYEK